MVRQQVPGERGELMAGASLDLSDLMRLVKDTDSITAFVSKAEGPVVELTANEYKNDVQAVIQYKTGTLRRSVHVERRKEAGHAVALVGTDAPYARRLEYGFSGADSLGRVYHQAPDPRWRPVWDNNHIKYERMMRGVFVRGEWEDDLMAMNAAAFLRPDITGDLH